MEAMRSQIESSPLFDVDLTSEADSFKAALKGAKIHGNMINAILRKIHPPI